MFRVRHTGSSLVGAAVALALAACGGSPAPKPTEQASAKPKVEAKPVAGIPAKAVQAFADGANALNATPPDYVTAAAKFEAATQAHPGYVAAWLDLAYSYEKLGRYADSAKAYQKVIQQNVNDPQVTLAYGKARMLSGEADAAITEFESVLRSDPKSLEARTNLAAAYQVKGDLDTSLRYVKEVLAIQPKNVPAIINLGLIYLKQKKLPLALLMFNKALTYDEGPDQKEADKYKERRAITHNDLGLTYFAMDDMPDAVNEFEKAIALDATIDQARLNVASIYLDWLDYETALAQFQAVRARFPKHYEAMVGEADCLYGTAKYPDAAKLYEESLEIRPENPEVLLRIGKLYEEQLNEPKKALAFYLKYRDIAKPAADDKINATIQFLQQADTLKPKPAEGGDKPAGGAAPAGVASPQGQPAPGGAGAPASGAGVPAPTSGPTTPAPTTGAMVPAPGSGAPVPAPGSGAVPAPGSAAVPAPGSGAVPARGSAAVPAPASGAAPSSTGG